MRVAVVYESSFGNTKRIAEAIADGLREDGDVVLASVDDPRPPLDELDLLVVGAPTHVHGLSSGRSRQSAADQRGEQGPIGVGVREWLSELPEHGGQAAAFDTRIEKPAVLTGSAARGIAKRLERHGFELVAAPESFFVLDGQGPLKDGELERAASWARRLASTVPAGA